MLILHVRPPAHSFLPMVAARLPIVEKRASESNAFVSAIHDGRSRPSDCDLTPVAALLIVSGLSLTQVRALDRRESLARRVAKKGSGSGAPKRRIPKSLRAAAD